MDEKKRMRVIKQDKTGITEEKIKEKIDEAIEEKDAEAGDTELLATVSYKLNESTILVRNMLAQPDGGGHSEMELTAFVDALAAFEIALENPERFVEVRAQYFAKEGEGREEGEIGD